MRLTRSAQRAKWIVMLLLGAFYLLLRLPRVREMPVFTDEATYLRWAQVIAEDPWKYLFVSMDDAKLPLHYWLLALVLPWAKDPVLAGRLLSVGLGLATIPAVFGLCGELAKLRVGQAMEGMWLGVVTALVLICCPYVAQQQRMAIAEPLLLLEIVVMAWLALRYARQTATEETAKGRWVTALMLGVTWGALLLTKQVFSYVCWVLPFLALATWWGQAKGETVRRFWPGMGLATMMGLAVFVPVLFTSDRHGWRTKLLYKPVFTQTGTISRWVIAWENVVRLVSPRFDRQAQWWPHDPMRPLQEGWYYVMLTPPLFVAVVVGVLWLLKRREWRVLVFLGTWVVLALGMMMPGTGVMYSRYLLTGTVPLLLVAGWCVTEGMGRVASWAPGRRGEALGGALLALVLIWPTWSAGKGAADWRAPTMPEKDMRQYISDFSAGASSEAALAWVKAQAAEAPVTLITGNWIGLPNDLLWLEASDDPRIKMYWYDSIKSPQLQEAPGMPGFVMLGKDFWKSRKTEPVALAAGERVYLMDLGTRDPETLEMRMYVPLKELPAETRVVGVFTNPAELPSGVHTSEMVVLELPGRDAGGAEGDLATGAR